MITTLNVEFRLIHDENLGEDTIQAILKNILNSKTDFELYSKFYVIKIQADEEDGFEYMEVNDFNGPSKEFYYKVTKI